MNRPSYKTITSDKGKIIKYLAIAYATTTITLGAVIYGQSVRTSKLAGRYLEAINQINGLTGMIQWQIDKIDNMGREIGRLQKELDSFKLSPNANKAVKKYPKAASLIREMFGADYVHATELFTKESGLNHLAINPSSGACGLVQSLPCRKLTDKCDFNDLKCQVKWGYDYIKNRYKDAKNALAFHLSNNYY